MLSTLENLIKLARERKASPVEGSYTNKLLTDKALSKAKVLEEVDELIEAIEEDTNKIHEAADVFYHLLDGIKLGNASAVLAASIFHYGKHSVKEAKEYLDSKGIPVRI